MAEISGGAKLNAALAEIASRLDSAATLRAGFLEGATYPDGKPVAMIAAIQNFGAPSRGIPPRPFFSNMVKDNAGHWPGDIARLLKKHRFDPRPVLHLMGEELKAELQDSIRQTNSPPLKPQTVARKGFSKPLVDTGHMLNSVDYEVTD